jgi:NAD(P)H-hydrate epimerase
MKEIDRRAIDEEGVSGEDLMEFAGIGLAQAIKRLAEEHALEKPSVLFVAGSGNNGGDAFVAAKELYLQDWEVECFLAAPEEKLQGDAKIWFEELCELDLSVICMPSEEEWEALQDSYPPVDIVVDGLLGTGASGEPRGAIARAIEFLDQMADAALVVAIDLPSLMRVRADLTVTMALPKEELMNPENLDAVGALEVVDIGLPEHLLEEAEEAMELEFIAPSDLAPLFPRRSRITHKGDFGHLLCVGGSKGFSGAITMAAHAAARSGAGLISARVPEEIHPLVAPEIPEVMVHTARPTKTFDAVLLGPGMGNSATNLETVRNELKTATAPILLDADAITMLASDLDAIQNASAPVILTPHPGEFATLFGLKSADVQSDRLALVKMAADKLQAVVVLKGAGTLIAGPGLVPAINLTGNPGMATGGSGDLLAGLIAGLLAQGFPPFEAACTGVWWHGRAADLAAAKTSQATLLPRDILESLPDALREISCR